MHHTSHTRGFTLIEILVSISIIALLSSVILSSVSSARKNARDSKRISSIRELQTGLELYYTTHGEYPAGGDDGVGPAIAGYTNWDTPADGDFLTALVEGKYMQGHVFDPLSDQDNLRYYKFPAGAYNCPANRGAFYVLGVSDMEVSNGAHQLSPGWSCPLFNFGDPNVGFEFVVGKFES